jgi:phenylacetic acid degradation operon negative regulatory protein
MSGHVTQVSNAGIPLELLSGLTGRPLTARSVIASSLLGTPGLTLPGRALVRAAELFGISENAARVALSRMVSSGELAPSDSRYQLTGQLVERSRAQQTGRHPPNRPWDGAWQLAVVTAERRPAADRASLRAALSRLRLGEWREGLWARPDNLGPPDRLPGAARTAAEQCSWLAARLADHQLNDHQLVIGLWDLAGWAAQGRRLDDAMAASIVHLEAHDATALRPCFLLAAVVLRHLDADPLLPAALLPAGWPGPVIRASYDRYEAALQAVLREWFNR